MNELWSLNSYSPSGDEKAQRAVRAYEGFLRRYLQPPGNTLSRDEAMTTHEQMAVRIHRLLMEWCMSDGEDLRVCPATSVRACDQAFALAKAGLGGGDLTTGKTHRDTASFGKRQEYTVIAELLRRGFDVYQTLVDDQGIDCIIRLEKGDQVKYLEIQIKARSKQAEQPGHFGPLSIPKPRPEYWFIFYSEPANTHWVISSTDLVNIARQNKSGKNAGRYALDVLTPGGHSKEKFAPWKDAFERLRSG